MIEFVPARPEVATMLFVDCPLCDAAAPFDAEAGAIDCPVCAVRLELVADEGVELATAA